MKWTDFEYRDFEVNSKKGFNYYQEYLKPCYYLELHLGWINDEELLMFHDSIMNEIGHLFTYHHNSNKSGESKFKDKVKIFRTLQDFLESNKTDIWHELSNNGGVGNAKEIGGVSDASLTYWIRKTPYAAESKIQQLEKYKASLEQFNTEMLGIGIKISRMAVCFPLDHFKHSEDFFDWIMNNEFIKKGTFFSGTAGYKINFWQGYVNKNAQEKLNQILTEFPGFDYDIGGNAMGRVLNDHQSDFLPIIKRLNWLTFISNEGVEELNGIKNLTSEIEKNNISRLYQLKNGVCIRACKEPALSEKEADFNQYYNIQKIISKLKFKSHPNDSFSKRNKIISDWFYKFENKTSANNGNPAAAPCGINYAFE